MKDRGWAIWSNTAESPLYGGSMKKKLVLAIFATTLLFASGCDDGAKSKLENSSIVGSPDITQYAKDERTYDYFYVVDNNTNVVYLQFSGYRRAGITVMLNADGTPITVDQLKFGKG